MTDDDADRRRMRRAVWAAAFCAAFYVPLVLGFLGAVHHAFDLFAHFRWHLAVLLGLAGVFALASRMRAIGLVSLLMAGAAFATTLGTTETPFSGPPRAALQPDDGSQPVYRLLQLNLRYDNPTPEKVLSLIGRVRPDIVTLDEVSPMWAEKLKLIKAAYPQQLICPSDVRIGGGAVLSLRPFDGAGSCFDRGTFATAAVDLGGTDVQIAALHLGWPWPSDQWWQIQRLKTPMAKLGDRAIAAGDFNAVSWSSAVSSMARAGSMKIVGPIGATWFLIDLPKWLRPWLGLEIDHVLVKGVIVHSARVLDDAGSDHAPVLIEFSLKPKTGQPPHPSRTVGPVGHPHLFG